MGTYGSARGAVGNRRSYRNRRASLEKDDSQADPTAIPGKADTAAPVFKRILRVCRCTGSLYRLRRTQACMFLCVIYYLQRSTCHFYSSSHSRLCRYRLGRHEARYLPSGGRRPPSRVELHCASGRGHRRMGKSAARHDFCHQRCKAKLLARVDVGVVRDQPLGDLHVLGGHQRSLSVILSVCLHVADGRLDCASPSDHRA